ncbi:MAG: VWA domain-containing protein, partial [Polyangiaceae bacterium]|nr:VWA domain-containing protein [Polyangiaceae bacterium]
MKFADPIWLWGIFFSLGLALIFLFGAFFKARAARSFGSETALLRLSTFHGPLRSAIAAALLVVALGCAFLAAARPQFGEGTRILPATSLDIVLVLDYSKSMYARDVSPSRISRAKVEVGRLVKLLGGARFGAVAFAGDSLAFPLTSDGAAIVQFFRGLAPNDMPLGGTAIARAIRRGQELLTRDPRA